MCGCNKRGSSSVRRRTIRPHVGPQSIRSAGATPEQLRALGRQNSQSASSAKDLDANRRKIEKLRRQAVQKRLGK